MPRQDDLTGPRDAVACTCSGPWPTRCRRSTSGVMKDRLQLPAASARCATFTWMARRATGTFTDAGETAKEQAQAQTALSTATTSLLVRRRR